MLRSRDQPHRYVTSTTNAMENISGVIIGDGYSMRHIGQPRRSSVKGL